MDRNFYTDDFERLLREKSDEFRLYPSKRIWHSIYNNIHPGRKWPSVAMSITLITAILLMGYLNSILKFGIEAFYKACYNSGVDGLIIPDLPLFEYKNIHQAFITKYNLSFSFLITPTTENNRALELSANSIGFVYLVSSNSTTGNTKPVKINLESKIKDLRQK